ncbi:MAG TPA: aminotransferase class V-fold PLP-dependent enzyme [Mycobacteriales bacterium]|nr:aminotransferase class V-fold PLP-dependent enzyme [Mycobacteriales bacterium]
MTDDLRARAEELDALDPLRRHREAFLPMGDVVAYLDGNSLGRPLRVAKEQLATFVDGPWADRLIRSWDEGWMTWPERVGDQLGRVALGAAPGQVVVADATTVLLYKLARAAVDALPERREVVLGSDDFPTDRYVLEGVAAERGLTLRWVETDPDLGLTVEQVAAAVGPDTALVVLSHVSYRSSYVADLAAIAQVTHEAGALLLADLCHSVGVLPIELDAWDVDLAVGCGYKYLNGGPGAPAFAYVSARHLPRLQQPVWGWMGRAEPFGLGPGYQPAAGVRQVVSGTPPVLAMVPLRASLDQLEEVGVAAVREKSLLLTGFALELADAWLVPAGVRIATPREPSLRGGHVTVCRDDFREVTAALWERGVIPDFRSPDGIRIGLAPLSTSFAELYDGMALLRDLLG